MRIILIHGYKSSPSGEFLTWLYDELRRAGHEVVVPALPNPEAPEPEEWTKALLEQVGTIDNETIILGHSLGGAAALRFLEAAEARSTPKGVVLVATPWMIGAEMFRGFFMSELDYDVIPWKASAFTVIHAKNDPKIPFDHAEKYARLLRAKLVATETGEHYQGKEYPVILEELLALAKEPVVFEPGKSLADEFADLQKR